MVVRPHLWKVVLILLVVIGTLGSQAASIAGHHSHEHVSHCCGVCHVGHISVLQAEQHFACIPPSRLYWHRPAEEPTAVLESGLVLDLSRAPPAV